MTTCLGKSCSFGLTRVPFVKCCQFMYLVVPLLVEGRMWDRGGGSYIFSLPVRVTIFCPKILEEPENVW